MSATKRYSITSNTKVVVNALEEDVTIYWVVQSGEEDDVIENLLGKYESLSDHIKVVKKNPDVYPTFTQQYTEETVSNNSLIVGCGERNRYIPYQITVGSYSTMDEQRYLSIGDGNVYLVSQDPMEEYDAQLSDLIRHDDVPDLEGVTSIQFAGAQEYEITYKTDSDNTYCADDVYVVSDGELPLDTTRVEGYLNTIRFLNLSDYVNYKVTQEELANYGLDAPDLTVTVNYTVEDDEGNTTDQTFTLTVGRSQDQKDQAADGAEDVSAYVRVGESSIIYQITGEDYDALLEASYNDLRHQEVYSGDIKQIYQVDVTLDGETYTLTADQAEDSTVWSYDGNEVDATEFESALTGLTASSFTDQEPEGSEEVRLKLYLTDDNFPTVEITLYRQDGTYCLAQVDGQPVCLVERSAVVTLTEAIRAIVLG